MLIILVLLVGAACAAFVYREKSAAAAGKAASHVVVSTPASKPLSLEERAALAQGTTLPPEARRPAPQEEATWFLQHCPGTRMDGEKRRRGRRGSLRTPVVWKALTRRSLLPLPHENDANTRAGLNPCTTHGLRR